MKAGMGEKKKNRGKKRVENVGWNKETQPAGVWYRVPVGRTPATGGSQEIPDKRILREEKEQLERLSRWLRLGFVNSYRHPLAATRPE